MTKPKHHAMMKRIEKLLLNQEQADDPNYKFYDIPEQFAAHLLSRDYVEPKEWSGDVDGFDFSRYRVTRKGEKEWYAWRKAKDAEKKG